MDTAESYTLDPKSYDNEVKLKDHQEIITLNLFISI